MGLPRYLLIMAKEPRAGRVKTRMAPPLAPRDAARLYAAFLEDTIELVAGRKGVRGGIAYTPLGAEDFFRKAAPPDFLLLPQPRGGLGRRLLAVTRALFARGAEAVCLMNSDGPDLPAAYLEETFSLLEEGKDAVFGPNNDGGYYLLGLRRPVDIFSGISWSTPGVLEESLDKAEAAGLRHVLLPAWPDLDTVEDLRLAAARWSSGEVRPPSRTYPLAVKLLASLDIHA